MKLFHKDQFKHEFSSLNSYNCNISYKNYCRKYTFHVPKRKMLISFPGAGGEGGVLGLIFAGYVPLASQSPYPIIVWACKCNFRDPNLVTFGSKSIDVPPLLLKWIDPFFKVNEEHFTFHLQYRHSGKFANREYEELSYPKNPKMCDPILVALWKMQPHYSQSSRENAIPSSGQPH